MKYTTRQVQQALKAKGFDPGPIDGIPGPKTDSAITDFKVSLGMRARPYLGPLTIRALFGDGSVTSPGIRKPRYRKGDYVYPVWLAEMAKYLGLHERRDNAKLRTYLRSDGKTLGDPAKFAWCGDMMETPIKLTLPKEPFPGRLGINPYWARNWVLFGKSSPLRLGTMIVMTRGSGGHICSALGYDPKRKRIWVRGGNQSNSVSDTWIDQDRVIGVRKGNNLLRSKAYKGIRAPVTWKHPLPPIPVMNSKGQVISRNEA